MSPHTIYRQNQLRDEDCSRPKVWITGLGAQYPPYEFGPQELEDYAAKFYNVQTPGLEKLLKINKITGIQTRPCVLPFNQGFAAQPEPPGIVELDNLFREAGVNLAVQACKRALDEWGRDKDGITHTIGVTCTNQGNPGYDLLVCRKLGLRPDIDRTLLHGVGCSGGLAIMRAAAQIASGATARGLPARILAFACEVCSSNVRTELAAAEKSCSGDVGIGCVLFSDAAAAFVLCNSLGLEDTTEPLFELMEWGAATLPNTEQHMSFFADPMGFRTILTREITHHTTNAVSPMFDKLVAQYSQRPGARVPKGSDFDWALHPGGQSIINSIQKTMSLTDHQLRASKEIYKTRGNSSSATVLIVLDQLRKMGPKDHTVATSFGPGLTIEMAMLRRCRKEDCYIPARETPTKVPMSGTASYGNLAKFWKGLMRRLSIAR